ncbi:hypothetical protein I4U23_031077 [Adineta vaga]|nr:hypothetical protein I4U23_031077 [Adineta vaga]
MFSSGPSIIHQQPRLSLSKWLCTSPPSINKSNPSSSSKSHKVRRSSSWRSLKERGNNYLNHFTSRTLSVDELRQTTKQYAKINSLRKREHHRRDFSHSPVSSLTSSSKKLSGYNANRLFNCDASRSLSTNARHFDRFSSTLVNYSDKEKVMASNKSHRRLKHHQIFSRNNTNSGGGDSGYSEDSFATTTLSSYTRPLHTSCPHCHCEQRSSFHNYKTSMKKTSLTDSSTSDTTINKETLSSDYHFQFFHQKQSLSASRSYPHIKPLPKTNLHTQTMKHTNEQEQKRTKAFAAKRRRHLSCDSSFYPRIKANQANNVTSSPVIFETNPASRQRHFTTIGMLTYDPSSSYSKTLPSLPKNTHIFGELNLAAIELDSLRTIDYHRPSFSSSYSSSLTSSTSSVNTEQEVQKSRRHKKKSTSSSSASSKQKGTYLVWHEYKNSSLLSATNGTKIFSVIRGDQVRLLRRIGKSTLLVQKEDDGSIGFLPQSCLAHDQINSFLSVKGLRETVL